MAEKRLSMTLCLIECGETVWECEGRIHGATDLPLSEQGRTAVTAKIPELELSHAATIYHPSDEAATETAKLCAKHCHARMKAVDELADPNLGLLEGLTEQQMAERFPSRYKQWKEDPISLSPPEGEDLIQAADRLLSAVAKIPKRSRADEIGIVLHRIGLGILRCWLADRPLSDVRAMLIYRPRIERYVLPLSLIPEMENATGLTAAR